MIDSYCRRPSKFEYNAKLHFSIQVISYVYLFVSSIHIAFVKLNTLPSPICNFTTCDQNTLILEVSSP